MPVSSTLTTSAPKSASISEPKPPGSSRVRSRPLSPSSGRLTTLYPQQLASLLHHRGAAPRILGHLPRLRDQLAVRARHRAIGQEEVVLEPDANRSAKRE